MSKTKKSKRKNTHRVPVYRRPLFVVLFFVAMAAAVICALLFIKPHPQEPISITTPTPATSTPAVVQVEAEPAAIPEPAEPENKVTPYEGEDPNTLAQLTGYITRKGVDDDILTIVAMVNQYLSTSSYCTITLTNSAGQTVYNATHDAVPEAGTSICTAFEVPTTNLPSGTYQITIDLSGDNKRGVINDEVYL